MGTSSRIVSKAACGLYGALAAIAAAPALAAVDLADSPLFLTVAVPPNITVTLDDSGSMAKAFVPDICGTGGEQYDCSTLNNRYSKSSHYNPIYYDPTVQYPAPKNADGTLLETLFTAAYRNGFDTRASGLGTRNLSTGYRPTANLDFPPGTTSGTEDYMGHYSSDVACDTTAPRVCAIGGARGSRSCSSNSDCTNNGDGREVPAYYYNFDETNTDCSGSATDNDCYDLVVVSETSGPGDTDETQNFANWYSFARTRHLATQTAASLAFSELSTDVRVAWQALNTCRGNSTTLVTDDCDGWNNTSVSNAIQPFTGTHRTNFYSWLFRLPTNNTTPLPAAMQRVGQYYRTSGENSPYDNDFTTSDSGELACRRNYHVMMTDGIWNDAVSVTGGNVDGTAINELPDDTPYDPIAPFSDTYSNTLADMAFYYWKEDLRTLPNNLLPSNRDTTGTATENYWNPRNNPATWQHMVNFTIGLGLTGYLSQEGLTWDGSMYRGSYEDLADGSEDWPQPGSNDPANVADLWHAAINSRGQFFSADNPASLSVAFRAALTAITDDSGSSAALSANSTSLTGTTLVYQAKFNPDWSGTLLALPVNTASGAVEAEEWDASELIPAHGSRNMFTHNGTAGVEFTACSVLSAEQQAALNTSGGGVDDGLCEARLQWLRGNDQDEVRTTGGLAIFRNRPETVMGDIVNSDPAYVQNVNYGYVGLAAGTPGQDSYGAYVVANAARMPMVYVGSNDGHLYGIRGDANMPDSGVEKFTYIPGGVFHNLSQLTDPSYAHRYYADGSITVGDAYLDGGWKTVLVAGLNAGGKSIYALDVTSPETFDESNVMWEFDAGDDADLGLTYSRPQIGILDDGTWVAVFGNGYNSTGGGAHLFVVNLETGALIRKLTASDTAGIDESNGMSTPLLFDADGDKRIDYAYAGDLHGNLWKFNLTEDSSTWGAVGNAPLFTGDVDDSGPIPPQPITAQPKIAGHHLGGQLVLFGTGRYLTNGDVFDESRQSFYGIWDNGTTGTVERSDLQVQWFDLQEAGFGRTVRSVSNNTVDWAGGRRGWYIDLLDGIETTADEEGERVVHTSIVAAGRVIFGSIIPSTDPCIPGGRSWLIELKLGTGGAFANSILDLNNDGLFNGEDTLDPEDPDAEIINAVSSDTLGISNVPVWIEDPNAPLAYKIRTGTTGNFATEKNCTYENEELCDGGPPTPPTPGVTRRSWIQIR